MSTRSATLIMASLTFAQLAFRTSRTARAATLTALLTLAAFSFASIKSADAAPPQAVSFDAPAIVVAEPLDPSVHNAPTSGGTFLRLKLTVSTMIHPDYRGKVDEVVVSIDSPSRALRVVDFWPKTEMYSQVQGTITVANEMQKNQNFAFNVAGGYEPFVRGNANGDFHSQQQVHENYERRPPMQMLTSSGTVNRGYGAFFKFRPGPMPVLEGDRELALLVEAPLGWRADLLHVHMQAVGQASNGFGGTDIQSVGSAELWTAAHLLGDQEAAQMARHYMTTEQAVRRLADTSSQAIQQRSLPTVFHKVGAALDVVQPKIPTSYLRDILFNLNVEYFNAATARLPVDMRVAALDYWDERSKLMSMAYSAKAY